MLKDARTSVMHLGECNGIGPDTRLKRRTHKEHLHVEIVGIVEKIVDCGTAGICLFVMFPSI
jgi:hypothetical protein